MSIVETFLEKLTYSSDNDGQLVIDTQTPGKEKLEFCVLNPAVQAQDELWTVLQAVALVGGTLQPLDVMMQELVPSVVPRAQHMQQSFLQCQTVDENASQAALTSRFGHSLVATWWTQPMFCYKHWHRRMVPPSMTATRVGPDRSMVPPSMSATRVGLDRSLRMPLARC
jgi:hypothetical protein